MEEEEKIIATIKASVQQTMRKALTKYLFEDKTAEEVIALFYKDGSKLPNGKLYRLLHSYISRSIPLCFYEIKIESDNAYYFIEISKLLGGGSSMGVSLIPSNDKRLINYLKGN